MASTSEKPNGANIRTDKMVGQEMIGGLAGGIKYDGDNLDALALSNISSQTNFVFHRNIFPYHGGFVGGILNSSTAKAITFENVVSTASKYYVDDAEPALSNAAVWVHCPKKRSVFFAAFHDFGVGEYGSRAIS